jgi:hypothetical protein
MPRQVKYTKERLQAAIAKSQSMAEMMRNLGIEHISGGLHSHLKRRISQLKLDTGHFLGQRWNRGDAHVGGPEKLEAKDIFVRNRRNGYREHTKYLRMALDEIGRKRICVTCGVGETWQGYPLVLEIDHRNGDPLDNRETNLEYRCPNCHSQIPNHSKRSLK